MFKLYPSLYIKLYKELYACFIVWTWRSTPHMEACSPASDWSVWSVSLLCDIKALLHIPHFDEIWSAGNAMRILFVLCAQNTPHPLPLSSSNRLIPGRFPIKQKLQCDNVSSCVFIFQSNDGCRKIWSVSLPTSRRMVVNSVTMRSSNVNSTVFHIWDSFCVCGATVQK